MEWLVTRVYDSGRKMQLQARNAGTVRGRLTVRQESDPTRGRMILVARVHHAGAFAGFRQVPPLYDVALVASTGEALTLTGHERISAGPLQEETLLGQSWIVAPAPLEDLRRAENEWQRLAELVDELRAKGAEGADNGPSL
jgi:hypothetical protein